MSKSSSQEGIQRYCQEKFLSMVSKGIKRDVLFAEKGVMLQMQNSAYPWGELPCPTGQVYIRGIFVEHSHDIFPENLEKVLYEIPGNIPK